MNYKKRYEFQKKMNLKQSEEIESLKKQIDNLNAVCDEKDKIIESVDYLRIEFTENLEEIKKKKDEYKSLIKEIREMKNIMSQTMFGSEWKWRLIRFLIK